MIRREIRNIIDSPLGKEVISGMQIGAKKGALVGFGVTTSGTFATGVALKVFGAALGGKEEEVTIFTKTSLLSGLMFTAYSWKWIVYGTMLGAATGANCGGRFMAIRNLANNSIQKNPPGKQP
ncbi:MAG: hypothetical protein AAGG81_03960 [Chlamydiota bacterium]